MHKHTKLTPSLRKEVYERWLIEGHTLRELAEKYHVDKMVIHRTILRGKLGDFSVHDSTNQRYRTIEYGLKRLSKTEQSLEARLRRQQVQRYEYRHPGDLIHGDNKRILYAIGGIPPSERRREILFIAIDDCTRWLVADLLPDRTMWSATVFLDTVLPRLPFPVTCHYSDNGGEYRGGSGHAFMAACLRSGISQRFTKPRHPWTNGKAERMIQTLLREFFRVRTFTSYEERRQLLYQFVDWYNHDRPHSGIGGLTPAQKLERVLAEEELSTTR